MCWDSESVTAPTHLAYQTRHPFVNYVLFVLPIFCSLYKLVLFTLYNIPYCKMLKFLLYYRHKEVIPMT